MGIREEAQACFPDAVCLEGELYGIVYYFHNRPTEVDADNLSKPVLDSLETVFYENDQAVKLRYSGVHDLRGPGIEVLDISAFPEDLLEPFLNLLDVEDHVVYVEIGRLDYSMFRFGCEREAV